MAARPMIGKASWWEAKWASKDFVPHWGQRGVSAEIREAVNSGWFPPLAPVLDIGCGFGDIAVWFAKQGYRALGVDVAPSAIARATELHAPLPPNLEFAVLDATREPLPNRQFGILIDRGCLHTIPPAWVRAYTRNVASAAAPGARMLLFVKAFRHGKPVGDPAETAMHVNLVGKAYAGTFDIVKYAPTDLNGNEGNPLRPLPAIVFWLVARAGGPVA